MKLTQQQKNQVDLFRAMDTIIRSANYEDYIYSWLCVGIADGDGETLPDEYFYDTYCSDKEDAKHIGNLFLKLIERIGKDGGIFDGVNVYENTTKIKRK